MKNKKIPTAEEFIENNIPNTLIVLPKWLIDFAKLHVKEALKEASKKCIVNLYTQGTYKGAKWILLKDGESYNPMEKSIMSKIEKKRFSMLILKKI